MKDRKKKNKYFCKCCDIFLDTDTDIKHEAKRP